MNTWSRLLVTLVAATIWALVAVAATTARIDTTTAAAQEYGVYYLGSSFEALTITSRIRRLNKPSPGHAYGADFYSFVYGDCVPAEGQDTCQPPLEVQSWAACKRNLSVYTLTPDGRPLPSRRSTIRKVPAASFEDGFRLELYTGKTTIVIFGEDRRQIRRAADALRPLKGTGRPGAALPPPAPGALTGKLAC